MEIRIPEESGSRGLLLESRSREEEAMCFTEETHGRL